MTTALTDRFARLDQLLTETRSLWQLRPFTCRELPWPDRPALQQALTTLDDETLQRLEADDNARCRWLTPYIPQAPALEDLCRIDPLTPPDAPPLPAWLGNHIPGRKWTQILAFEAALENGDHPYLEWCAGKGHLGRLLAYRRRQPVTSLEWDPALCQAGQQLADKAGLPCRLVERDVLAPGADAELQVDQHAVALHACGKLHVRLLETAAARGTEAISLAPCCYHLIDHPVYQPLSRAAAASALRLEHLDLQLPLQALVTGGQGGARRRRIQLCFRLGFDLLQRDVRGVDQYLPCPTLPGALLAAGFEAFCRAMAERKQLALPANIDFEQYLRGGRIRAALVDRIELVRHLFRRPLELWLLLDRCLFLEEQGYRVRLDPFCDYRVTPRNLLIRARRSSGRRRKEHAPD